MPRQNGNIHLSVVAGICATIGSLFGKLAGGVTVETTLLITLKLSLLVLMIASNTAGCTFFVKSLQGSGSSLPSTVASAATNYFCSIISITVSSLWSILISNTMHRWSLLVYYVTFHVFAPKDHATAHSPMIFWALIGFLVFGESTSLMWWIGTTLVLCGLLLICYAPVIKDTEKLKQR